MSIGADDILARCRELGFALAGVCAARPSDFQQQFRRWIDRGEHGSMAYLERNLEKRLDPAELMPGARSIIMVADQYAQRGEVEETRVGGTGVSPVQSAEALGRVARYAHGRDYHVVMKKRLHRLCDWLRAQHPDHEFRAVVDTAPFLEREHAARAGLGWIGKHTLLIHPRLGSWLLLGGVLTTLEIDTTAVETITDHCGACTRCIDACPTDAITPYSVNASRCISYLTIERREPIDPDFHEAIDDWIFGCDICQEVCPHNSPRPESVDTGDAHEAYEPRNTSFDLLEILGWTEDDRRRAFQSSALKRATLDMFKRNAAIALHNQRAAAKNIETDDFESA